MALLAFVVPGQPVVAQGTAVFSRIDVAGNQRIEADSIRAFAGIEPGQPVTPEQLNLAVRNLFDTGLFEDATVMPEAGRLVITVKENPTINQIAFEGNDSLDDDELAEVIQLRPRLAYSVPAAEADAQRIIEAYRAAGRYAATVTPVIIRQSENRVDLVFEVSEGRKTGVERISFSGNRAFSDRRLRRVIETNQTNWLSFAFGGNTYDADKLELDKELLRQFYLERGYIDVQVLSSTAEMARERTGFFLSFTISEGQQYSFGKVSVSSSDPRAQRRGLPAAAGAGGEPGRLQRQAGRPGRAADELPGRAGGLCLHRIRPRVTKNANRTVDINFEIAEGQRVFVERIDITGNNRTLDRVVRRQFHIVEGDAFNSREVKDAEDRINGLGFFKTADVNVRPGISRDQALIEVAVEEQPTGSLSSAAPSRRARAYARRSA